ncbi:hypothetical protein [Subtercola sp. RTI3]|uniref:hypothetical protein n=1 Tax=Subtercola sp. RTI3 TaxID=3048639 RepID=UPI002B232E6A|nr:hypothetical protein [Subtercola sp. RTI3]MEA9986261.1 hypothetical protein [Subtercola sp. RTI3]
MSARTNNLPENQLVQTVAGMREDVDTIKTAQRIGALNLQTCLNQSANASDKTVAIASAATATITITFTSAVQQNAIAALAFKIYAGSLSNEVHPDMTSSTQWPSPAVTLMPPSSSSPYVTIWTMKLFGIYGSTTTFLLKFAVQSTDAGSITAV